MFLLVPSQSLLTMKPQSLITSNIVIIPPKQRKPSRAFSRDTIPDPHLNPFQKIVAAALDSVEKLLIQNFEKKKTLNPLRDPVLQLSGNFGPVQECPVRHNLQVDGHIPSSVRGVYLRNGGNPLFPPAAGHHLFDGDGMIHAVTLGVGIQASYACRFIRTNRLVTEAGLGRCVFLKPIGDLHGHLGLARLLFFNFRALVGLVDVARGVGTANTSLVYFNDRILAMSEDDLPYEIRVTEEGDLETIQRYNFDEQIKEQSLIAHPKVDPTTGELYTLSYNILSQPHLKFFKFDKYGKKEREIAISLPQPTMVHDFAISEDHVIIPDLQVVFKLSEMIRDGSPIIYDPKKVPRLGVFPKDAVDESMIQWIDVPNCFFLHMYNAWEEYDDHGNKIIIVIVSSMTPPEALFSSSEEPLRIELSEIRIKLSSGESTYRVIVSGMNLEGGQVDKRLLGKKARYIYMAIAEPWPKCSGIARVDLSTGIMTKFLYGTHRYGGEPCFVPAKGREEEDEKEEEDDEKEGYVMSFVRDEEMGTSEFVILKASTMKQVAIVKFPTRVPYGIHGTFVTSQVLRRQAFSS